jgi:hypothetical protein
MCLETVQEYHDGISEEEVIVYKLMDKSEEEKNGIVTPYYPMEMKIGHSYVAEQNHEEARDHHYYETGFHCFTSIMDALKSGHSGDLIVKFKAKGLLVEGTEGGAKVLVFDEVRPIRVVARKNIETHYQWEIMKGYGNKELHQELKRRYAD